MALAGNLKNLPLLEILRIVSLGKSTGSLTLNGPRGMGQINVHLGEIIYAGIENSSLRIGQVMIDRGFLSEENLEEIIAIQRNTKPWKPLGFHCLDLGYVSEDDLKEVLAHMITHMVFEMAKWHEGIFRFEEGKVTVSDQIAVDMQELMTRSSERISLSFEDFFDQISVADVDQRPLATTFESPDQKDPQKKETDLVVEQLLDSDPLRDKEESDHIFYVYQEVSKLKEMLSSLGEGRSKGEISLSVLRFASEYFQRVILFFVQNDNLVGLGHFGVEGDRTIVDQKIRSLVIPTKDNLLADIIDKEKIFRGTLTEDFWRLHLHRVLGDQTPKQSAIIPISVLKKVKILLYGDNRDKAITRDFSTLLLFTQQVGMAFEIAFLNQGN